MRMFGLCEFVIAGHSSLVPQHLRRLRAPLFFFKIPVDVI